MMLSKDFYDQFINYEYLLICHVDTWCFRDDLEKWCNMGFDHVAAPWPLRPRYEHFPLKQLLKLKLWLKAPYKNIHCELFNKIGNGGFSLRRVKIFRDLCIQYSKEIEYYKSHSDHLHNEDVFWALVPKEIKVPSIQEALNFAFDCKAELCYKLNNFCFPMAAHGFNRPKNRKFWQPFIPANAF